MSEGWTKKENLHDQDWGYSWVGLVVWVFEDWDCSSSEMHEEKKVKFYSNSFFWILTHLHYFNRIIKFSLYLDLIHSLTPIYGWFVKPTQPLKFLMPLALTENVTSIFNIRSGKAAPVKAEKGIEIRSYEQVVPVLPSQ